VEKVIVALDPCAFLLGAASQEQAPLQGDSLIGHRKTKSMLDDPGELPLMLFLGESTCRLHPKDEAIPERLPMLPTIIPELPGSLLASAIEGNSASPKNESTFGCDIFDAFSDVPSEIPQRPASYAHLTSMSSPVTGKL